MSDFSGSEYLIRRKVFKLFGGAFHVYDGSGAVVAFSELKAFKLKEDVRLYADETKSREVLRISARKILDISATYDVYDSTTDTKVGALKRKGLKSILHDEWEILDTDDLVVGLISEDSTLLAILRRFLTSLIPQEYNATVGDRHVCTFKQHFNPFVLKLDVRFEPDTGVDRRLLMAAGVMLSAIEGRQD